MRTVSGSSPQMRGAPPAEKAIRSCGRDHPRRCGEHRRTGEAGPASGGSSPQMRGARLEIEVHPVPGRIIPADAGSTATLDTATASKQDHPRRCGEHARQASTGPLSAGSSPQMRGARPPPGYSRVARRIIPADAGSTLCRSCISRSAMDHPRRCGEHLTQPSTGSPDQGSSPQMRGAPPAIFS